MKRSILSLIACLVLFGTGYAQISDMTLGYCNGEIPSKGDISFAEADADVSAAIFIPAGTVNTLTGNELTGMRAALASRLNIESLTVWVRTSLDGENLTEQTITASSDPKIVKGWNTFKFDTPYKFDGKNTTGLYLGYTYHQKKSAFGIAAVSTPCNNAFYVKFGNSDWENRSDQGCLSIEGFIQGDNLPKVNLQLMRIETPDVYIIDRGTLEIDGLVKNLATHTVTGFDVSVIVGGNRAATSHVDCDIPYNTTYDFNVTLPLGITEVGTGEGKATVLIDNLTEGNDEDMTDNSLDCSFTIIQHDYTRRILVEEFTTEKCPNCPRVAGYMHEALAKEEFKDNVLAVCHHVGYYTDFLTTPFDSKYLWLFNQGGSTFAPAMMADRKVYENESPIFNPTTQSEMEMIWRNHIDEPAFVSVNITAEYDAVEPDKIHVKVNGSKSMPELCDNPTLTVFLIEDDIAAKSQANGGTGYVHQHVNRAVNSTWGDPIVFNGDDYTYECEFALKNIWNRDNLSIVAFVANYNENDPTDCEIQNANRILFSEITGTAIDSVWQGETTEPEYYTVSGTRVNKDNLQPGIYVRLQSGKAQKTIIR